MTFKCHPLTPPFHPFRIRSSEIKLPVSDTRCYKGEGVGTGSVTYLRCQTVSCTDYLILGRYPLELLVREWMLGTQTVFYVLHILKKTIKLLSFVKCRQTFIRTKKTTKSRLSCPNEFIIIIVINDCKFGSPNTSI